MAVISDVRTLTPSARRGSRFGPWVFVGFVVLASCGLASCGGERTQVALPATATPIVAVPDQQEPTPAPTDAAPTALPTDAAPTAMPEQPAASLDLTETPTQDREGSRRDREPAPSPTPEPVATVSPTTTPEPTTDAEPTTETAAEPTAAPDEPPTVTPTPTPDVIVLPEGVEPTEDAGALLTPAGITVPILGGSDGGWWVLSPCAEIKLVTQGELLPRPTIMIDPGHGGGETGAVGPEGVIEKDVNWDVSNRLVTWLNERDISTMLTRNGDYRVSIKMRGELAKAVQPDLFLSIHHNGGSPEPIDEPGTEVYFQYDNPDSERVGGLMEDELYRALADIDIEWTGNPHRGAQWRLSPIGTGRDLYGVLRRPAEGDVVAVLTEAMFVTSPAEEQLLLDPAVLQLETEAIGRAVERYLFTDDTAGRINEGVIFAGNLGSGGGTDGCVDPDLE